MNLARAIKTYLPFLLELLFGLAIQAITFRFLSLEDVGKIAIIQVILIFGQTITDFGANSIAARIKTYDNLGAAILRLRLGASFAAILLIATVSSVVSYIDIATIFLIALCLLTNATTPVWDFIKRNRYTSFLNIQLLSKLIQLTSISAAAFFGILTIDVILGSFALQYATQMLFINALCRESILKYALNSRVVITKDLIRSCLKVTVSNLAYNFARFVPIIALSLGAPLKYVAIFSACDRLLNAVLQLRSPLYPQLVYHINNLPDRELYRGLRRIILLVGVTSCAIAAALLLASPIIIPIIFGNVASREISEFYAYYLPNVANQFMLSFLLTCALPAVKAEWEMIFVNIVNIIALAVLPILLFSLYSIQGFGGGIVFADFLAVSLCLTIVYRKTSK